MAYTDAFHVANYQKIDGHSVLKIYLNLIYSRPSFDKSQTYRFDNGSIIKSEYMELKSKILSPNCI